MIIEDLEMCGGNYCADCNSQFSCKDYYLNNKQEVRNKRKERSFFYKARLILWDLNKECSGVGLPANLGLVGLSDSLGASAISDFKRSLDK